MDLLREEKARLVDGLSCFILFPLKDVSPPFSGIIKLTSNNAYLEFV